MTRKEVRGQYRFATWGKPHTPAAGNPPLCRLRHVAKRYGCFAFCAWSNRLLGEALCRGRSPGEPHEARRGEAPAPLGILFCPLWGPGVALSRQVPRSRLLAIWPQASRCCRRGGRREALGEPRRGALHPARRFFVAVWLSTARTGFKVLKRFKSFSAKKDSKIYLNQRLMGLSGS